MNLPVTNTWEEVGSPANNNKFLHSFSFSFPPNELHDNHTTKLHSQTELSMDYDRPSELQTTFSTLYSCIFTTTINAEPTYILDPTGQRPKYEVWISHNCSFIQDGHFPLTTKVQAYKFSLGTYITQEYTSFLKQHSFSLQSYAGGYKMYLNS